MVSCDKSLVSFINMYNLVNAVSHKIIIIAILSLLDIDILVLVWYDDVEL